MFRVIKTNQVKQYYMLLGQLQGRKEFFIQSWHWCVESSFILNTGQRLCRANYIQRGFTKTSMAHGIFWWKTFKFVESGVWLAVRPASVKPYLQVFWIFLSSIVDEFKKQNKGTIIAILLACCRRLLCSAPLVHSNLPCQKLNVENLTETIINLPLFIKCIFPLRDWTGDLLHAPESKC